MIRLYYMPNENNQTVFLSIHRTYYLCRMAYPEPDCGYQPDQGGGETVSP